MIVKNEQADLPRCLESVQGAVDEIVVCDTGSTDETINIARAFGARVTSFTWNGRFDDARNHALSLATGDWILSLDADEMLLPMHFEKIRTILGQVHANPQILGFFIWVISPTPDRTDMSEILRIFRRRPDLRFVGRIHEDVGPTIEAAGGAVGRTPIAILHEGYRQASVTAKDKWVRNEAMLLQEDQEQQEQGAGVGPIRRGLCNYNLGHHFLVRSEIGKAEGAVEEMEAYRDRARGYLMKALETMDSTHTLYPRLIFEAEMAGIKLSQFPGWGSMPLDPIAMGLDPDPLMRAA